MRRSSTSATSRRRRRPRRSWCRRTARCKTVADLKGKNVALNKGSNVHYLLVKALEKAGLAYSDIQDLVPAAGGCARRLRKGRRRRLGDLGAVPGGSGSGDRRARSWPTAPAWSTTTNSISSSRDFVDTHPDAGRHHHRRRSARSTPGSTANRDDVAEQFSPALGIPEDVLEVAVQRQQYGVKPITPDVVAAQQKIADVFLQLGLIPHAISIADAVKKPQS